VWEIGKEGRYKLGVAFIRLTAVTPAESALFKVLDTRQSLIRAMSGSDGGARKG